MWAWGGGGGGVDSRVTGCKRYSQPPHCVPLPFSWRKLVVSELP